MTKVWAALWERGVGRNRWGVVGGVGRGARGSGLGVSGLGGAGLRAVAEV